LQVNYVKIIHLKITEEWNKRSNWVSKEIVSRDKAKGRALAISHFIKIAEVEYLKCKY
jgi:hypothetical protein